LPELKKLILDTSICIDLYHGKLLKAVLQLKYKIILPDVMLAELEEPAGELLLEIGFIQEGTSGEETNNIFALRNEYANPSTNDLVALYLAKRNTCDLITGDNALRNAAKREGVTAHGLFWLMDALVEFDIITKSNAFEALKNIIEAGSWLPKRECEERLKKWYR
jgi:predicted nucleic acid-binding protein